MAGKKRLTIKEAAAYFGKSPKWLYRRRKAGNGPRFFKDGSTVLYEEADLESWWNSRKQ